MAGLLTRLTSVWKTLFTPRSVREIEERGIGAALREMPPPPDTDPWAGLSDAERRNRELERRMRDMGRLYDRRRGG